MNLAHGSTGPEVEVWQRLMRGIDAGLPVDGKFGQVTELATQVFQRLVGLDDTGIVNTATRKAMGDLDDALAAKAQADADRPPLRFGDRGDEVAEVQQAVNHSGLGLVQIDGVFGRRLLRAVQQIQGQAGLPADGVVDAPTRAVLDASLASGWWIDERSGDDGYDDSAR